MGTQWCLQRDNENNIQSIKVKSDVMVILECLTGKLSIGAMNDKV